MGTEELERLRNARDNFGRIAKQANDDAGTMEVIFTHLPLKLRERAVKFAEDLRHVSDDAAELVTELDQVLTGAAGSNST